MKKSKEEKLFETLPPECDALCEWRSCLHKGLNKGPYTAGRGYTSYYTNPVYCCMTRLQHGCPEGERESKRLVNYKQMLIDLRGRILEARSNTNTKNLLNKLLHIIEMNTYDNIVG